MGLKYPLTPDAKEIAISLVQQWNNRVFGQFFQLVNVTAGSTNEIELIGTIGVTGKPKIPPIGALLELSRYGLIEVNPMTVTRETKSGASIATVQWDILLLQELRNAVSNDFAVSEYFLTVNAVGTIINTSGGDLTIAAPFQSAAASGDIYQNQQIENLSYEVREILGHEFLNAHSELRQSLDKVGNSDQANRVSNLGNLLGHLANLVTIGEAIPMVSKAIELVSKAISSLS